MIKQTRHSDISGEEIPQGTGAEMRITPFDGRKDPHVLDVTDAEAKEFSEKGRKAVRRGRTPQRQTRRREPAPA